jgi:hypothetical protein
MSFLKKNTILFFLVILPTLLFSQINKKFIILEIDSIGNNLFVMVENVKGSEKAYIIAPKSDYNLNVLTSLKIGDQRNMLISEFKLKTRSSCYSILPLMIEGKRLEIEGKEVKAYSTKKL